MVDDKKSGTDCGCSDEKKEMTVESDCGCGDKKEEKTVEKGCCARLGIRCIPERASYRNPSRL